MIPSFKEESIRGVHPAFELLLKASLTPEKPITGELLLSRNSLSTGRFYNYAAVAGDNLSVQVVPANMGRFIASRYIPGIAIAEVNPHYVTISPDGKSAYVANYGSTTMSQYSRNTSNGLLTALSPATIATGTSPISMTISPSGDSVYVTNYGSDTVSQYSRNITTGLLTALSPATIATGTNPISVVVSTDGNSAYVANFGSATVSQYSRNITTGLLTALSPATIATGTTPVQVTIAPDGNSVYVANFGSSSVSQYSRNITTGLLTALSPATIATGTSPYSVTISPDNTHVYTTNSAVATVSQYSREVSTGLLTALSPATIATGTTPVQVTIAPDGNSVYVANFGSSSVSQYSREVSTGLLTALSPATIATGTSPYSVTISPDNTHVYTANYGAGTVSQYSRNITTGLLTALSTSFEKTFADGTPIPNTTLKGILVEGSRTNLFLQGNAFSTAPNSTAGGTLTYHTAEDNWTFASIAGTGAYIIQTITNSIGVVYSLSLYIKKTVGAQSSYPLLSIQAATAKLGALTIDTTNGIVTPWTEYTAFTIITTTGQCVDNGDGYWRVTLIYTSVSTSHSVVFYSGATSNPTQSTGVKETLAGSSIIRRMQLEAGTFPSSDILTTTAAVTRAADILSIPSINLNSIKGGIYFEFMSEHPVDGTIFLLGSYVDANNYTGILHDGTNIIVRKRIAGINYDATMPLAYIIKVSYKLAMNWDSSGLNIAVGGVLGTANTNTTPLQLGSVVQVGADGNGGQQFFGEIKNLTFYNKKLNASKLVRMTQ